MGDRDRRWQQQAAAVNGGAQLIPAVPVRLGDLVSIDV